MIRDRLPGHFVWPPLIIIMLALFVVGQARCARSVKKGKRGVVSIVFFYSKECEHCETVARLLESLKGEYPIRLKKFDIDIARNYTLFSKLEAIHTKKRFAVPLVILGESILMGERDIKMRLEPAVRELARSGGASFPYLGPKALPKRHKRQKAQTTQEKDCDCDDRRPPTLREEWNNIRAFLDRHLR